MLASNVLSSKRSQLVVAVGLWLLSSFLCSRFLITSGTLYLDHLRLYSYSYDNLHALNRFGEAAWWFPHNQGGVPGYVYSQLGIVNGGTPVSGLLGIAMWLLGAIGIHIESMHTVYVIHHFWVLPALLLGGVWCCARQLFAHGITIVFVLILTAFSPAILQNVKDPGFIEITAYGFYFVAAWVYLLRAPTRASAFWAVVLAACVLVTSLGFAFLVWNVFFIPLVVAALWLYRPARAAARRALAAISLRQWLVAATVLALCLAPKVLVFHEKGDLVRANIDEQGYRFEQFRPGNPWQVLLSGVPAVGFGNTSVDQYPVGFIVMPSPFFFHSSYLGVLALPLVLFGLLFGRASRRTVMFTLLAVSYLVILLAANSPLLAPLLMPQTPMRSVNHYFDICYGFGGVFVLVFAAGFGLDTFLARPAVRRWLVPLYLVALAASILIFCLQFADSIQILGSAFGFYVLAAIAVLVVLVWTLQARTAAALRHACLGLLCLTMIDVSTIAWHYLKPNLQMLPATDLDLQRDDGVGLASADANSAADTAFESRELRRLVAQKHLDFSKLPAAALFTRAHPGPLTQLDVDLADPARPDASLAMTSHDARAISTKLGTATATATAGPGRVDDAGLTYDTHELHVTTATRALLFVRTAYSPYWHATVDGESTHLFRALGHFSAIVVPPGSHVVQLRFSRSLLGVLLLLSWAIVFALTAVAIVALRRERRARARR